ncbi:hypothetical protein [Bifidobacterium sp. ESL0732]|uniref:hypothetical protein n=1 Tax=Bifidobacterium sp. ESL0732 TaxID=2983222 RepID=UPI0023F938C4|nr:hypothetical protein [Bifidobacterium sp. ESL0732]WEV64293.1 hypothetical protein OZX70_01475 [Bifidobacterium sp. ESL0732]
MKSGSAKDARSENRLIAIKRYFQNADILARPLQLIRRVLVLAIGICGLFWTVMMLVFIVEPLNILSRIMLVLLGVLAVFLLCYAIFMAIFRAPLPISARVKTFGVPAILLGLLLVLAATIFDRFHTQSLRIIDDENFSITLSVFTAIFTLLSLVLSFKLHNGYYRASAATQWEDRSKTSQSASKKMKDNQPVRDISVSGPANAKAEAGKGPVNVSQVQTTPAEDPSAHQQIPQTHDTDTEPTKASAVADQSVILIHLNAKHDWLSALQRAAADRGYRVLVGEESIDCIAESEKYAADAEVPVADGQSRRSYRCVYENGQYSISCLPDKMSARRKPERQTSPNTSDDDDALVDFLFPESAVLYLTLLMENPYASRPTAIVDLVETYRGEDWKVPERAAEVVSPKYFSVDRIRKASACLGKYDGAWSVLYKDSSSRYYPVASCATYAQALQCMMDVAWVLQCNARITRELGIGNSRHAQQTVGIFVSGQSARSAVSDAIAFYVPTFRLGRKVAGVSDGNGAQAHGDASYLRYVDEDLGGLCRQQTNGIYRPERLVVFEFAMICLGWAVASLFFAALFWFCGNETKYLVAFAAAMTQVVLLGAMAALLLTMVQRLTLTAYRWFIGVSWATVAVSAVALVALLLMRNPFYMCVVGGVFLGLAIPGYVRSAIVKVDWDNVGF